MSKVTDILSGGASVHPRLLTLPQHLSHCSHVFLSGDGRVIFLKHCLHQFISFSHSKKSGKVSSDTTDSEIKHKCLSLAFLGLQNVRD